MQWQLILDAELKTTICEDKMETLMYLVLLNVFLSFVFIKQ